MSGKTFHKDLLRTLLKSKMRFISILAIIALGVGFFAGIKATEPDMLLSADRYFKQRQLSDFRVISPMGFRQEDLEQLAGLSGFSQVQPGYMLDLFLYSEAGNRYTVRLFSYDPDQQTQPEALNQFEIVHGRGLQNPGDILIDANINVPEDIGPGSVVTLAMAQSQPLNENLSRETYQVVGSVHTPLFITYERGQTAIGDGKIDFYAYICQSDFNLERFVEVYIRTEESSRLTAYSEAYAEHLVPYEQELTRLGEQIIGAETEGFRRELEEGRQEWLDNKRQVEEELRLAEIKLDQAEREIETGEQELADEEARYRAEIAEQEAVLQAGWDEHSEGLLTYYDAYARWLQAYNVYQDGRDELNQARRELDTARVQLDQAERELEFARRQLDTAGEQLALLDESLRSLEEIRLNLPEEETLLTETEFNQLIRAVRPYSEELAQYIEETWSPDDSELVRNLIILLDISLIEIANTYDSLLAEYQAGRAEYQAGRAELDRQWQIYEAGYREYEQGEAELRAGKDELDSGMAELERGKLELDQAAIELEAGESALNAGRLRFEQEIEAGRQKLAEAREELAAGRAELASERSRAMLLIDEAEAEIRETERQILELPEAWIVMTRENQPGYSEYGDDARRIGSVATIFPLFFFLIAALVCLTTMTRMIEEERVQIGTLKALGFGTWSIASKYLIYALAASLLGSVIGLLLGFQIFPNSIMNAYALLYHVPVRLTPFHLDYALVSILLAVVTTVLVTYLATVNALRAEPASLMQPRAPKPGKRILLEYVQPLWQRLTFMQKLTARNLFRYKQRLFMTIIGISGCTALLLTGFGIKDSVNAIIGRQFESIFVYDGQVMIDPEKDPQDQALDTIMSEQPEVEEYLKTVHASVTAQAFGSSKSYPATLLVPEDLELLSRFYSLRERISGQILMPPPTGVIITEKLADLLNLRTGDSLQIRDAENRSYVITVSGIAENYLTHYIYMSAGYFDQITYRDPDYNSAVFNLADAGALDRPAFQESLLDHPAVLGSMLTIDLADDFARSIQSLNYVVIILILSAGALAFVVLYNLTSINIAERIREIATIKVLGFRDREVSDYVFRENMILTILGTLAGLLLGLYLHRFVMNTMETDAMMFGQEIHWLSYLLSVALTIVFSLLVNVVMFYRLRKIELVESLKSAE